MRKASGLPIKLCIVGKPGRAEDDLAALISALDEPRSWIRREPHLSDEALEQQYRSSWLVVQPSLDEGFGLPVLEACGNGVPALHSGRGALSEVYPDGSVDSLQPEAIAEEAIRLLEPVDYAKACRSASESAQRHDWRTFAMTWQRAVQSAWAER
jgi:glycosyltransferase involved in cell wall biosynthesis